MPVKAGWLVSLQKKKERPAAKDNHVNETGREEEIAAAVVSVLVAC